MRARVAKATKVLEIEGDGETQEFLVRAKESHGEQVSVRISMAPGSTGPFPHRHPLQTEELKVEEGSMELRDAHGRRKLKAGDAILIGAGHWHTFRNALKTKPLVVVVTIEPALHFEWYLTAMARSAQRNGGHFKAIPWVEMGTILYRMRGEFQLARIPKFVQRFLFGGLARWGRLTGKSSNVITMAEGQNE